MRLNCHNFTLFCVLFFGAASAAAETLEQLRVSTEHFRWNEFLPDDARFVRENGARFGLGLAENNLNRPYPGIIYHVSGALYFGRVNYAGQAQDESGALTPVDSYTDYLGSRAELLIGQRYGQRISAHQLDVVGGLGFDSWVRNLYDATDESGQKARGFLEIYRVWSAKVAVGLFKKQGQQQRYLQFGLKYPLHIYERATIDYVVLEPGPALGFFVRLDLDGLFPRLDPRFGVSFYYDVFRFEAASDDFGNVQPRSRMDVIGLQFRF